MGPPDKLVFFYAFQYLAVSACTRIEMIKLSPRAKEMFGSPETYNMEKVTKTLFADFILIGISKINSGSRQLPESTGKQPRYATTVTLLLVLGPMLSY